MDDAGNKACFSEFLCEFNAVVLVRAPDGNGVVVKKTRRRTTDAKNNDWWNTPHIDSILEAVRQFKSVQGGIERLKKVNPSVFANLDRATVSTWFTPQSRKDKTYVWAVWLIDCWKVWCSS